MTALPDRPLGRWVPNVVGTQTGRRVGMCLVDGFLWVEEWRKEQRGGKKEDEGGVYGSEGRSAEGREGLGDLEDGLQVIGMMDRGGKE